jgi:hypothetical protein
VVVRRQMPEYYFEVGQDCLFFRRQCFVIRFHAVIRYCIISVCVLQYGAKKHTGGQDATLDRPNTRAMTFLVTVLNKFGALPMRLRELTMHPSVCGGV